MNIIERVKAYLKKHFTGEVFYVNGSDTLPPPLTRTEEAEVFARLTEHDPEARNILIEHNLRLVVYIAKKFESTGIGIEDLVSIGTIGLIKAVNTFCPTKNIKLATYASRCIDNEILMYLRKNKKIKTEISFDESLSFDLDGNELHLEDILGTEPDVVTKGLEEDLNKKIVIEEINKLAPRDKEIIVMRYGLNNKEEKTQKEVAEILGISQSYISRIEKKVIKRIKSVVNN